MPRLVRITTVPVSLQVLLKGQMRFMRAHGFEVTMISSSGPELEALKKQEGCEHRVVEMTRKITPWKDLKSLIQLVIILRKLKPEIVHTHTPKAGLLGMWAARIAGVPIRLHTIAGLPWMESRGIMRMLLKNVEKLTAMAASEIFPNSFVQKDFLFHEGIAQKKMRVLGNGSSNGIDCTHFSKTPEMLQQAASLRMQAAVPDDGWVWVFVGRIVKDKGIAELMEAFNRLYQKYPNDSLWLLGNLESDLDPLSEKHLEWLQHHPGIKWWDFQKDIRPFLAASKALVFPSYREGFPNVPLQAAAMGCLLILSDINGCNEIVSDGKDGLLVPVKKTEELYMAMQKVRSDESLSEKFRNSIGQKIKNGYDQQTLWHILLQEYRSKLMSIQK